MTTKRLLLAAIATLVLATVTIAADSGHAGHASAGPREHFGLGRPLPPGWAPAVHDSPLRTSTLIERAEFRTGDVADAVVLDAQGWIGGDYHRFAWELEAEQLTRSPKTGEFEVAGLHRRAVSPFWDAQAGLRLDRAYSGLERETRGHVVFGFEGVAPYWVELEPMVAISDRGKLSFTLTATYELLLTRRWVLEPRVELRLDEERPEETGGFIGEGTNDFDFGLRLRYDIRRSFSPYVGVEWHRPIGASSGVARRADRGGWQTAVVFGVRTWF